MAAAALEPVTQQPHKKPYIKRTRRDVSQRIRLAVQLGFLALNVWIGVQFYFFVRQFETYSATPSIHRPAGIEGWLPIAGMMNTKYWIETGSVAVMHPAAMFLFLAFLTISFVLRKAFCGWLCPVGTVSEWLWKIGKSTFGRVYTLPKWLDIVLRSLKYVLFGLFFYAVITMPAEAIASFLQSPYGVVADVKMLNFFRYLGTTGAIVIGLLVFASFFIQNFWCRYLCPYGAVMGLAALASPLRIRRSEAKCIDCAKCAKACPSQLPVDRLVQIRSAECLGCMECVAVCPAEGALEMSFAKRRRMEPWMIAACVVGLFVGVAGYAKATGHWDSPIPDAMYQKFIPRAAEFGHP